MASKTKDKTSVSGRKRSAWSTFGRTVAVILDVILVAALVLTGYAGNVSPLQHGGLWGVFPLAFMPVLLVCFIFFVLQLLICRIGAGVLLGGFLLCAGPILDNCPIRFSKPKIPEGAESFTLMSYNVHNFGLDDGSVNPDTTSNPQVDYIIRQDADIVCLQEASEMGQYSTRLSWSQRERLFKAYPEVCTDGTELVVLSKYPVKAIHLDDSSGNFGGGHVSCYHVTLPSGRIITLFNVHLESYKLHDEDRSVYVGLTELKRPQPGEVKSRLIDKAADAAVSRAQQARQLMRYIRLYGGPDAILTGDFNDVPGCYTIRTLEEAGFRDTYPAVGSGPLVTFNSSRLYFCIDHTMYRGALVPVRLRRGKTRASDHYPLVTTFYVGK